MGSSWLIFKIVGFTKIKNYPFLGIWFASFLMFWYAYFGDVSVRYLAPIIPPLSIFVALGFTEISSKLNLSQHRSKLSFLAFSLLTSYLFLIPLIPFRYVDNSINVILFEYHTNQILVWIYISLISIGLVFFAKNMRKPRERFLKLFSVFLISTLAIVPVSVQIYYLHSSSYDLETFHSQINYYHRDNYQELVQEVIKQNLGLSDVTLTVNTPGLEYFTKRSVLDIFLISGERNFEFSIYRLSTQEALDFINDINIQLIVELNSDHIFYDIFYQDYFNIQIYQIARNSTLFDFIYENPEFILYRRI